MGAQPFLNYFMESLAKSPIEVLGETGYKFLDLVLQDPRYKPDYKLNILKFISIILSIYQYYFYFIILKKITGDFFNQMDGDERWSYFKLFLMFVCIPALVYFFTTLLLSIINFIIKEEDIKQKKIHEKELEELEEEQLEEEE